MSLLAAIAAAAPAAGDVVRDGTIGPGAGVQPSGPNYLIDASMGAVSGDNLFHSFGSFDLVGGQSAVFSSAVPVDNLIVRVTGGGLSTIDGLLSSTIPGADFFFLNPAGVLFGSNASIDVQGAFHASTADYLELGGSEIFPATGAAPILSVAPVSAFGFLGPSPAAITLADNASLTGNPGSAIALVGGDLTLGDSAWLTTYDAPVSLVSVGSAGEAELGPGGSFVLDSFAQLGDVLLEPGAWIESSSAAGAAQGIFLRGASLTLDGAYLSSAHDGSGSAAPVDIAVTGLASFENGSSITTSHAGSGAGPTVWIRSGELVIRDSALQSVTGGIYPSGRAGDLILEVGGAAQIENSTFYTESNSLDPVSAGGDISIQAQTLEVTSSLLFPAVSQFTWDPDLSASHAPSIFLATSGDTTIQDSNLWTYSYFIDADYHSSPSRSAGDIQIEAQNLNLLGNSSLDTTSMAGGSGIISLHATQQLLIDGGPDPASDFLDINSNTYAVPTDPSLVPFVYIDLQAQDVILRNAALQSSTYGSVDAGAIFIGADSLLMDTAAGILTQTLESPFLPPGSYVPGDAGYVGIDVGSLEMIGMGPLSEDTGSITVQTFISSDTATAGAGGLVDITAATLDMSAGAFVSSNAYADGDGGFVQIHASDHVALDGSGEGIGGYPYRTSILTETYGTGAGGAVFVHTPSLSLSNGAYISASTQGEGAGGLIQLDAGSIDLQSGSVVEATSQQVGGTPGDAGYIVIGDTGILPVEYPTQELSLQDSAITTSSADAGGGAIFVASGAFIDLLRSEISTSVLGGTSDAGFIELDTPVLILDEGSRLVAQAELGVGGSIVIVTDAFLVSLDSLVSASSNLGIDGTVTVQSPYVDVSGDLAAVPSTLLDAASLMHQRCAAQSGAAGSFVVSGRDGLPATPDGPLQASLDALPSNSAHRVGAAGAVLAEAVLLDARADGSVVAWAGTCRSGS